MAGAGSVPWPWVQILAVLLGRSRNLLVFQVKGVMTTASPGLASRI